MAQATITGTITTNSLEAVIVALIRYGQSKERDPVANTAAANRITSSTDEDELVFTAQINFPATVANDVISVPDYLNISGFSVSIDGVAYSNWAQALAEVTIELAKIQAISSRNPGGTIGISSWELRNASQGTATNPNLNASFNASYRMPLEVSAGADGGLTSKGREFTT